MVDSVSLLLLLQETLLWLLSLRLLLLLALVLPLSAPTVWNQTAIHKHTQLQSIERRSPAAVIQFEGATFQVWL